MSPRKVRLVVDLIRGLKTEEAIQQLQVSIKQAAKPVLKLLQSAMANAKHNHGAEGDLTIKTIFVDGGTVLKRWMPRAMGRATPVKKRTSHITIILEGENKEKKSKVIKSIKSVKSKVDKKEDKK